jgi:hypothetical protein
LFSHNGRWSSKNQNTIPPSSPPLLLSCALLQLLWPEQQRSGDGCSDRPEGSVTTSTAVVCLLLLVCAILVCVCVCVCVGGRRGVVSFFLPSCGFAANTSWVTRILSSDHPQTQAFPSSSILWICKH